MEKHDPQPERSNTRLAGATARPFPSRGGKRLAVASREAGLRHSASDPVLSPAGNGPRASIT